jgi:hypothetical protein
MKELNTLFSNFGLKASFYGDTPVADLSLRQRLLRPIKKLFVMSGLMPKSMAGKKFFKKIVFGKMVAMPTEIGPPVTSNKNDQKTLYRAKYNQPKSISSDKPNTRYKVIYCEATLI